MAVSSLRAERTLTSLYAAIHRRRDVRGQFTSAPIDRSEARLDIAVAAAAWDELLTEVLR